jgi:short-subunit dehydrogenase
MKNVLITGGSSGIGLALAQSLLKSDYKVILVGRDEQKLKIALEELNLIREGCAFSLNGDTSVEADVDAMFDSALQIFDGRIDGIVLNAGVGRFGNISDLNVADYDLTFNTNVRGVWMWMRKVVPVMKAQGSGQIIVTSSNLGVKTAGRCTLYSASKFAVQSMVGCLRDELKGTGVKAATINPGSVDTPWFDGKDVDRSKMLSADDVGKAAQYILEQSKTSDIDMILLNPGKN